MPANSCAGAIDPPRERPREGYRSAVSEPVMRCIPAIDDLPPDDRLPVCLIAAWTDGSQSPRGPGDNGSSGRGIAGLTATSVVRAPPRSPADARPPPARAGARGGARYAPERGPAPATRKGARGIGVGVDRFGERGSSAGIQRSDTGPLATHTTRGITRWMPQRPRYVRTLSSHSTQVCWAK